MAKKQSNKKSNKASNQIRVVLRAIDDMKDQIIATWADDTLPEAEKTEKLMAMRDALRATERHVIALMNDELQSPTSIEQDEMQESSASFQWTEPATTEDAFKQVQLLVPMIDEIKSKIAAVELDKTVSLSTKASKLREMKACLESVQLRVVELSERYLQDTKCAA